MEKATLLELYITKKFPVSHIASKLKCSENKINYWLKKHEIHKRSISEAIYLKHNPQGDPFNFRNPHNYEEAILFGMGIGLYWGEGTKANKNTIRLGNSDSSLIKTFMVFLESFFGIKKEKLKFQLQVFSDVSVNKSIEYWLSSLEIKRSQLFKTMITPSRSPGTYKKKNEYGVMTLYFGNTKARNLLIELLPKG